MCYCWLLSHLLTLDSPFWTGQQLSQNSAPDKIVDHVFIYILTTALKLLCEAEICIRHILPSKKHGLYDLNLLSNEQCLCFFVVFFVCVCF